MSLVHEAMPSAREIEILILLDRGLSQIGVAKELFLSPRTIETYVSQMKKRYQCGSSNQLVGKAVRLKWIE